MARWISRHLIPGNLLRLSVLCPLVVLGAFLVALASQKDVTTLEPGAAIERGLKGGESHAFRVHLAAGQFLHLVVEQRGIDVEVTLNGPDGRQVVNVDSPNGSNGPEPVVLAAEATGDYRLEVISPNKKAAAGHYEIRIVALREATPTDRDHVTAERSFEEAYRKLGPQRTAASRRAAIEKYQQALPFYQSSGDRYRQALTLYIVGITYAQSGEFRKAVEYYDQALPLFRAVGDRLREGVTLNSMGGAYDVTGDLQKALDYYGQALLLARAGEDRPIEAIILNNIGKIYNDLADWQKAVDYYTQALPLFRAIGDQRREANTLHNIGRAYSSLGEREKALEYFQQALLLWRASGDKAGEAFTLDDIGFAHALSGEMQKALEFYGQALPLRRAAGDRLGEAFTLDHMGVAHSALGEQQKALEFHQQALQLRRAIEDRRGEAISLGNIGHVYNLLHQPQTALDHHGQALSLFRAIGDRQNEAKMLQGIARAERDRGNLAAARQKIEEALSRIEEVRARVGGDQLRASYFASRQDAYHFYIELLMQLHRREPSKGHDAAALAVNERARARSLLDLLTEARADVRQGVDAALLERERSLGRQLNDKAQHLTQANKPEQVAVLKQEISQLENDYERAQADIRKASPHYAALTQPQPLKLTEIQAQLDADTLLLEYALGEERSYLWAISKDSLTSYELPKGEQIKQSALAVYELLTARSASKRVESAVQRQQRITQAETALPAAAQQLSQTLLAPVAAQLGNKRLVIVADGALQYIPFAMLPDPVVGRRSSVVGKNRPLIVNHEVVSLPSASTLAIQRKELAGRQPAPKMLAVIADPVFERTDARFTAPVTEIGDKAQAQTIAFDDARSIEHLAEKSDDKSGVTTRRLVIPRLPFTRQEANQLIALTPKNSSFRAIDFQASRATVLDPALSQYRYVHFATHGLLDSERPGLSSLVLSMVDAEGKPQDGFLRANDIYNLKLPAELVVLSACQTGLGKEIKGEGLVGLTRGFMYAGAARVVVSLWSVNDKATADLMTKFYERMLRRGERPAAALRAAQVEMWKQKAWQSPYYWAAFTMQGEWR